jgi:hypothetical protein
MRPTSHTTPSEVKDPWHARPKPHRPTTYPPGWTPMRRLRGMVTLDAVPHTVPGTYAGRVSRRSWRSSTRCMPIRRRRCGVSPAVRVRGLSPPGADLQLLRPGADLLRWRLCAACSPPQPAGRWTALPNQPSWGRLAHAVRARRYRARRKKVTHHGSPLPPSDDLLASGSPMIASEAKVSTDRPSPSASRCHWCGRRCSARVRQGFLRRRVRRRGAVRHNPTGHDHGDTA